MQQSGGMSVEDLKRLTAERLAAQQKNTAGVGTNHQNYQQQPLYQQQQSYNMVYQQPVYQNNLNHQHHNYPSNNLTNEPNHHRPHINPTLFESVPKTSAQQLPPLSSSSSSSSSSHTSYQQQFQSNMMRSNMPHQPMMHHQQQPHHQQTYESQQQHHHHYHHHRRISSIKESEETYEGGGGIEDRRDSNLSSTLSAVTSREDGSRRGSSNSQRTSISSRGSVCSSRSSMISVGSTGSMVSNNGGHFPNPGIGGGGGGGGGMTVQELKALTRQRQRSEELGKLTMKALNQADSINEAKMRPPFNGNSNINLSSSGDTLSSSNDEQPVFSNIKNASTLPSTSSPPSATTTTATFQVPKEPSSAPPNTAHSVFFNRDYSISNASSSFDENSTGENIPSSVAEFVLNSPHGGGGGGSVMSVTSVSESSLGSPNVTSELQTKMGISQSDLQSSKTSSQNGGGGGSTDGNLISGMFGSKGRKKSSNFSLTGSFSSNNSNGNNTTTPSTPPPESPMPQYSRLNFWVSKPLLISASSSASSTMSTLSSKSRKNKTTSKNSSVSPQSAQLSQVQHQLQSVDGVGRRNSERSSEGSSGSGSASTISGKFIMSTLSDRIELGMDLSRGNSSTDGSGSENLGVVIDNE